MRSLGEREVTSRQIGEIVMEELHQLDEVAYVRYASVYRHFQDVEAFREEVDRLRHRRGRTPSEDQLELLPGERRRKPRQGQARLMTFSAFDEAAMRRALELARARAVQHASESARRRGAGARRGNRRRGLA